MVLSAAHLRALAARQVGLRFEVVPSTFPEDLNKAGGGAEYARATARAKAEEVAMRCSVADVIISADTVVELAGEVLEKPASEDDARRMLSALSGTRHAVHTGVTLLVKCQPPLSFVETTHVQFASLSPAVIDDYIMSGEPFGKAGSYAIQGRGGALVSGISGCHFNVVGLPLHRVCFELARLLDSGALPDEAEN